MRSPQPFDDYRIHRRPKRRSERRLAMRFVAGIRRFVSRKEVVVFSGMVRDFGYKLRVTE